MALERVANQPAPKTDQAQKSKEADMQAQFEQTAAQFMVSMAQQQGQRALEGMQEARNEEG